MHAPSGDVTDDRYRVALAAVNHVGSAKLERKLQTRRHHIDGDDRRGTGDLSGKYRRKAHSPTTKGCKGAARGHFQRVDHRTGAGLDAAAERAQQLDGSFFGDANGVVFAPQCVGGKRGLGEEVIVECNAVFILQGMASIRPRAAEVAPEKILAVGGLARVASQAMATVAVGHDHVVADF
ncbi:hypothetical protein D3C77_501180 [compost metagenome]